MADRLIITDYFFSISSFFSFFLSFLLSLLKENKGYSFTSAIGKILVQFTPLFSQARVQIWQFEVFHGWKLDLFRIITPKCSCGFNPGGLQFLPVSGRYPVRLFACYGTSQYNVHPIRTGSTKTFCNTSPWFSKQHYWSANLQWPCQWMFTLYSWYQNHSARQPLYGIIFARWNEGW